MKFTINESGYYSGYSPNGNIPMSFDFNMRSLPTQYHKWDGSTFVLDIEKQLADNKVLKKDLIVSKWQEQVDLMFNYSYNGEDHQFEIDDVSIGTMATRLAVLNAKTNPSLNDRTFYCCQNNEVVFDDKADIELFCRTACEFRDVLDKNRIKLKKQVSDATSIEDLDLIDISKGWE